jgi:hypothetical protein
MSPTCTTRWRATEQVTKRAQLISSDMSAILNPDDKDNIQLSAVEDHDGILTIRGGGARRDWNGIQYKQAGYQA